MFSTVAAGYLDEFLANARRLSGPELDTLKTKTLDRIRVAALQDESLVTETEVAKIFRVFSRRTLQAMRYQGRGPAFYKLGADRNSRVYYKIREVREFIDKNQKAQCKNFNTHSNL